MCATVPLRGHFAFIIDPHQPYTSILRRSQLPLRVSSPSTWHSFTSPFHHLHCAPQHRPLPCLHDWSHRSSAPQGGLVQRLAGSKRSAWDCIYSFPSRKVKTDNSVLRTSQRVLLLFTDPEGTTSSRIIQEVAANSTSKYSSINCFGLELPHRSYSTRKRYRTGQARTKLWKILRDALPISPSPRRPPYAPRWLTSSVTIRG